jgi:hypothetical protein
MEEAAGLLGITLSTARGVLKTIFAKTGTNRQASLVRLLLSGPPGQVRSEGAQTTTPGGEAGAPAPKPDAADDRPSEPR